MIQRIQTIWLLLAFMGLAACFMFPAVVMHGESATGYGVEGAMHLVAKSNPDMLAQIEAGGDVVMDQKSYFKVWPVSALAAVAALLSLVTIFMFRNRVHQLRMVAVAFLLNVVYVFVLLFWAVDKYNDAFNQLASTLGCDKVEMSFGVGTWVPMATIILLMAAQRCIKKDEAKVRAADRLR